MDARKISGASFLDILFEGRNKDYGAYYLRKTYSRRLTTALLIMFAFAIITGGLIALSHDIPPSIPPLVIRDSIILRHFSEEEEKREEAVPETVSNQRTAGSQTRYVEPVILPDNMVNQADILPTMEEIGEAIISTITVDHGQNGVPVNVSLTGTGPGIFERRIDNPDSVHMSVEIQASFDGDWLKFLRRNLDAMVPAENGAVPGDYRVVIQFVVDENGNMSNVTALTRHGYGMEDEAIRVLKRSPKWKPARQHGREVKAYRRQPIVFRVL